MNSPSESINLARIRLKWLLGDWTALAELGKVNLTNHPDRKALVLLAIVGCQQCGKYGEARELVVQARCWQCSREEVAQSMLGGLFCTLGRALLTIGRREEGILACRESICFAPEGIDSDELSRARASHQIALMEDEHFRNLKTQSDAGRQGNSEIFERPSTGIVSYAQNFEDVMLWRALGRIRDGFYIDIGAQDPTIDSVSKAFYENGWRGIHVEPIKTYAKKIRLDRPDEIVLEAAVNDLPGDIEFYEIPDTGISTGNAQIAQGHKVRGFSINEISVPSVSLAEVLSYAEGREIHWMKIDVEGMEGSVLRSWRLSPRRPWVVVVESTLPLTEISSHSEWEIELLSRGYEFVYFDGLNRFYLASERINLKAAFISGPNVFDNCTLSGLASATFYRR